MTAATSQRKATSADITRARELAAAGWGPTRIAELLTRDGLQVSRFAVARWINPDMAARHYQQSRRWKRHARADQVKPRLAGLSVDARMARMRLYRDAGLSHAAIATFFSLEHGEPLTDHEVREALRTGRPPRRWRTQEAQAA